MIILSNSNILFRDGDLTFLAKAGYIGPVPEWVPKTKYFASLLKDGKIIATEGSTSRAVEKAVIKSETARKAAKKSPKIAEKKDPVE